MKIRKPKAVYIELSKENYEELQRIAKKIGLKGEQVANLILECEVDIMEYSAWKRKRLAKWLEIRPTRSFIYRSRF